MAARKRVIQSGIRLSKFQEINAGGCNRLQSSRDSVNFYSSLSSNSSGHLLDYKQISQFDKSIGKRVYTVSSILMAQEANLSKFKSEILNSQKHHFALLQYEIEKTCGELRYEIYKASTDLRLDLKQEFYKVRAHHEAAKYDVIKYLIGTLYAVGIGMIGISATKQ